MSDTVINITNLVKEYKMYARKKDRLLEFWVKTVQESQHY